MFDEKLNSVDDEQVDVVDQQQDDDEINDVSDEKQKKQSSKENSRQRQKRISLEAEIKRLKEENDELKNLREENNALIKAANGFGFEGNDGSSLALAMEAQQRDMSIEELMLEKQLKEQEINDQVEKNPKFIKAMKDSETLSQMLADMKASETLQKLQKCYDYIPIRLALIGVDARWLADYQEDFDALLCIRRISDPDLQPSRYAVHHSQFLFYFQQTDSGGTFSDIQYGQDMGLCLVNAAKSKREADKYPYTSL